MLADDPEAPTTISGASITAPFTGGPVKGSVGIDAGSIQSIDPAAGRRGRPRRPAAQAGVELAAHRRQSARPPGTRWP